MNSPLVILTACAGLAFAVGVERLPSGLELQLPGGWQVLVSGQGAVIVPPGQEVDSELYIAGVIPEMKSLDDTRMLPSLLAKYFPSIQSTPAGQPVAFAAGGGRGVVHSYDARQGATPLKMKLYLVGLEGRGVAVLVAVGKRELIANRNAELMTVARSFHASQVITAAPANGWTQRLSDKKLMQFSSYASGGNAGGYNSERKLLLAAGGSYAFRSSSSVSVYVPGSSGGSSGQTQDQGRWRVIERGNDAMLELVSSKGTTERIILTTQGTQTFLNGRRWFVVGINE